MEVTDERLSYKSIYRWWAFTGREKRIHHRSKNDDEFYDETVSFLDTEIKLHSTIKKNILPADIKIKKPIEQYTGI